MKAEYLDFLAAWHRGNDNGDGFPVGLENDNIFAAIRRDGDRITAAYPCELRDNESSRYREFLALATRPDGSQYIVCDSSGPWGVEFDGGAK